MARAVKLVPIETQKPTQGRQVRLTPVEAQPEITTDLTPEQVGITRGAGAEFGDPSGFRQGIGEAITSGARATLPLLGLVGGAAVGAPSGPAGSVGGAGLGYAAGERGADVIARLLGQQGGPADTGAMATQTAQDVLTGGTIEAGGQVAGNLIGRLGGAVGKVAKRKISNVLTRQAKDLEISPKLMDVVQKGSPDFQAAVTGKVGERTLVARAKEAVAGTKAAIDRAFSARLEKLGKFDDINLKVPEARINFTIEKYGLKRAKNGKIKVDTSNRGELNLFEQSKLKEVVEKFDSKLKSEPILTLDKAERFRQELRDAVKSISRQDDVTLKGRKTLDSFVQAYEDGIDSLKPGYAGLAKEFREPYQDWDDAAREIGFTSDRVKDSTVANKLRSIVKQGNDIPISAMQLLEKQSGINLADVATGNQIAKTLEKGGKTKTLFESGVLKSKVAQPLSEYLKSPAERIAESPPTQGRILGPLSKLAGTEQSDLVTNLIRTLAAQQGGQ